MKIGDYVKIKNFGGFYSNYYEMAIYFNMSNWESGRYPNRIAYEEIFKIVGIRNHGSKLERLIAGIENNKGEGYIFNLNDLESVEPEFELGEELFLV